MAGAQMWPPSLPPNRTAPCFPWCNGLSLKFVHICWSTGSGSSAFDGRCTIATGSHTGFCNCTPGAVLFSPLNNRRSSPAKTDRLGDMVSHEAWRRESAGTELHLHLFPLSIAAQYLRATNNSNNLHALDAILAGRQQQAHCHPGPTQGLVHIRMGDVLDASSGASALISTRYVRPLSFYERAARAYIAANVTKVTLVGATYRTNGSVLASSSFEYLQAIHAIFRKRCASAGLDPHPTFWFSELTLRSCAAPCPLPANPEEGGSRLASPDHPNFLGIRLNADPDTDFVFMAQATYFVCSGGGFSRLIASLVARRRGRGHCVCHGVRGCAPDATNTSLTPGEYTQ